MPLESKGFSTRVSAVTTRAVYGGVGVGAGRAPEQVTAPVGREKCPREKQTASSHSLLCPPAHSKGTATNLPEKEISAFLSTPLNEALMLLWFHRLCVCVGGLAEGGGGSVDWVMQG